MNGSSDRMTEEEFVINSIKKLREPPYKGIHSVYSGFNRAFRVYFNKDPVKTTQRLAEEGKLVVKPVKGGVILYLPEDVEGVKDVPEPDEIIKKIHAKSGSQARLSQAESEETQGIYQVLDEKGSHKVTKFAMTAGPKRIWFKDVKETKVAIESLYTAKDNIKSLDREKTHRLWDNNLNCWLIDLEGLKYAVDHLLDMGYELALSPEVSKFLPTAAQANFNKNDVIEHKTGKRGKVVKVGDDKIIVKRGSNKTEEWVPEECHFVKKGRRTY